jgi:ketosteroid isomerase-like protein
MRIVKTGRLLVSTSFLVAVLAAVAACQSPPPPTPSPARETHDPLVDRADVVEAHETLLAAMEKGDAQAVTALLDTAHDVLVFHPETADRFDGPEAIAEGIATMLAKHGPVDVTEVHLQAWVDGDVAWLTSHVLLESPELPQAFAGRGTEVWRRTEGGWRLAHAHWSKQPPG